MRTVEQERERNRLKSKAWYSKPENKKKVSSYNKKYREDNIVYNRIRHRTKYSGWTNIQFEAAWESQKGLCAICEVPLKKLGLERTSVAADHDHEISKIRGLLCRYCNSRLHHLEDLAWKQKAEAYLIKHKI